MLTAPRPNLGPFLEMLAWAEIGPQMLAESDRGYNVIAGSRPGHMILFHDYSDHPRRLIEVRPGLKSTAAGRYQILRRIFDHYKKVLRLPDFYPASQDAIAIRLLEECGAMRCLEAGDILGAISAASSRWASLPGNAYEQPVKELDELVGVYRGEGGTVG